MNPNLHNTVSALAFQEAARILAQRLTSACGQTHQVEIVDRRCERGIFLRPTRTPDITQPTAEVYKLRDLPAWRGVEMRTGIILEGFASRPYQSVLDWMMEQTTIDCYKWRIEDGDLYIFPRGKHGHRFSESMLAELEALASRLERRDEANLAVLVEILVPIASPIKETPKILGIRGQGKFGA